MDADDEERAVEVIANAEAYLDSYPHRGDVVLYIVRSSTLNMVVYQARRDVRTGEVDHESPLDVFWLSIDPETRAKKAAASGGVVATDRDELGFLERSLAFGVKYKSREGKKMVSLNALPKETVRLVVDNGGRLRAVVDMEEGEAFLEYIYIKTKPAIMFPERPVYAVLFGKSVDTGEPVCKRRDRK